MRTGWRSEGRACLPACPTRILRAGEKQGRKRTQRTVRGRPLQLLLVALPKVAQLPHVAWQAHGGQGRGLFGLLAASHAAGALLPHACAAVAAAMLGPVKAASSCHTGSGPSPSSHSGLGPGRWRSRHLPMVLNPHTTTAATATASRMSNIASMAESVWRSPWTPPQHSTVSRCSAHNR